MLVGDACARRGHQPLPLPLPIIARHFLVPLHVNDAMVPILSLTTDTLVNFDGAIVVPNNPGVSGQSPSTAERQCQISNLPWCPQLCRAVLTPKVHMYLN
jgi:hypothetical protein